MNQAFEKFKRFISPFGLNDQEFDALVEFIEFVQFKKGDVIMNADEKQKCIYYISNGIVRNFVITRDGEIKTYAFRIENMLVTGYGLHNYKNEHRAKVSVECLQDCDMLKIPLTALRYMEECSVNAHKVGRYLSEEHTMELVEFIIDIDTMSVIERYNKLESIYPNIHQRVSQHIIASYLGITPVHLSNIKKKNLYNNKSNDD